MGRSRNIKPGFFYNELLVELPYETRLLFIGLWTVADKSGRMEDRPKRIKMALFPADNIDIDRHLDLLARGDDPFIVRYEIDGSRYIAIVNWDRHQKPHHQEKDSEFPAPPTCPMEEGQNPEISGQQPNSSGDLSATTEPIALIPDSLNTDSLNLIPDSLNRIPDPPLPDISNVGGGRFDLFWKAYPKRNGRKVGKAKARRMFEALSQEDQLLAIRAARNLAGADGRRPKDPQNFLAGDWREWIGDPDPDYPDTQWINHAACYDLVGGRPQLKNGYELDEAGVPRRVDHVQH